MDAMAEPTDSTSEHAESASRRAEARSVVDARDCDEGSSEDKEEKNGPSIDPYLR